MDALLSLLEQTLTSPWLYALIAAAVAVDSTVPALPAETLVLTAGTYAAQGVPHPGLLVVAAVLGALLGDHVTYQLGRSSGAVSRWMRRSRLGDGMFLWARRGLHKRGGALIVGARFIPGGRTCAAFTSGVVRYPRSRFLLFSGLAAVAWALYYAGIGYAGGVVFHEQPLVGMAVGIGLALLVGLVLEGIRRVRGRMAPGAPAPRPRPRARDS